jgi:hypothetical protein
MEKHRTGGILEKRSEAKVGDGAQPRTERGTKPSAAYRCRFDFFWSSGNRGWDVGRWDTEETNDRKKKRDGEEAVLRFRRKWTVPQNQWMIIVCGARALGNMMKSEAVFAFVGLEVASDDLFSNFTMIFFGLGAHAMKPDIFPTRE